VGASIRLAYGTWPPVRKRAHRGIRDDLARLPEGPAKGPWMTTRLLRAQSCPNPTFWDKGKIKPPLEPTTHANLHLTKSSSPRSPPSSWAAENPPPANYQYRPLDYRRDIPEGWWLFKKYNCMGCHQLIPGQRTSAHGYGPPFQGSRRGGSNCLPSCLRRRRASILSGSCQF